MFKHSIRLHIESLSVQVHFETSGVQAANNQSSLLTGEIVEQGYEKFLKNFPGQEFALTTAKQIPVPDIGRRTSISRPDSTNGL
jgi:hypothetical protein